MTPDPSRPEPSRKLDTPIPRPTEPRARSPPSPLLRAHPAPGSCDHQAGGAGPEKAPSLALLPASPPLPVTATRRPCTPPPGVRHPGRQPAPFPRVTRARGPSDSV